MYVSPTKRVYGCKPDPAALDKIEQAIISHFNLKPGALATKTRKPEIAKPRQYYFYLAATLTKNSQQTIADRLGFDRTMVVTSRDIVKDQLPIYEDLAETITTLRQRCGL